MKSSFKFSKILASLCLLSTAFLTPHLNAQDYDDPDALSESNEALPLVRCIQPLSSVERAIYCAKQHGGEAAIPQEGMTYSAEETANGWVVTQVENIEGGSQWVIEISAEGDLVSVTN